MARGVAPPARQRTVEPGGARVRRPCIYRPGLEAGGQIDQHCVGAARGGPAVAQLTLGVVAPAGHAVVGEDSAAELLAQAQSVRLPRERLVVPIVELVAVPVTVRIYRRAGGVAVVSATAILVLARPAVSVDVAHQPRRGHALLAQHAQRVRGPGVVHEAPHLAEVGQLHAHPVSAPEVSLLGVHPRSRGFVQGVDPVCGTDHDHH